MKRPARLCLADGTTFEGEALGAPFPALGAAVGEVVFTTGMTGYEEVLTDPSFTGQIATMTAPQIGNTGIAVDDAESDDGRPRVAGFVVRDASTVTSSWRARESLDGWLERQGTVVLSGVDTRRLTRHLREHGAQNGAIGARGRDDLVDIARAAPSMEGLDLVKQVTPKAAYEYEPGPAGEFNTPFRAVDPSLRVVAIDLGTKQHILRCLSSMGCRVRVVPATTTAEEILALSPDGVFVSSGPGDPASVGYAIDTLKSLIGKTPVFGICLGHQLLALASGASTYKLKFGHRGLNQPVLDKATGRVEITSQNHGFAVDLASLPAGVESTHIHLNDGTSEGLRVNDAKAFSVQYHPEAAAGPHDAHYLFQRFVDVMQGRSQP